MSAPTATVPPMASRGGRITGLVFREQHGAGAGPAADAPSVS